MSSFADLRVVFRAAADARSGCGPMVRCLSIARALGVRPLMSIRGDERARDMGLTLGADLLHVDNVSVLAALEPDVVVIDDPRSADALAWMAAARRVGAIVVSMHGQRAWVAGGTGAVRELAGEIARTIQAADATIDVRVAGGADQGGDARSNVLPFVRRTPARRIGAASRFAMPVWQTTAAAALTTEQPA